MISEKKFAESYRTFWVENAPYLSDYYSTEAALGRRLGARGIDIPEDSSYVYINNLIATTHFRNISTDPEYSIEKSFEDIIPVIDVFGKTKRLAYKLTDDYKDIIRIQAERLAGFYSTDVIHDPQFPGCGLMHSCRGDLLHGKSLIEIKANSGINRRPFKPENFRQVLVYCALNYLAGSTYDIQTIELFNPRSGYHWISEVDEFVYLVANVSGASFFEQMGKYLTGLAEPNSFAMDFND